MRQRRDSSCARTERAARSCSASRRALDREAHALSRVCPGGSTAQPWRGGSGARICRGACCDSAPTHASEREPHMLSRMGLGCSTVRRRVDSSSHARGVPREATVRREPHAIAHGLGRQHGAAAAAHTYGVASTATGVETRFASRATRYRTWTWAWATARGSSSVIAAAHAHVAPAATARRDAPRIEGRTGRPQRGGSGARTGRGACRDSASTRASDREPHAIACGFGRQHGAAAA